MEKPTQQNTTDQPSPNPNPTNVVSPNPVIPPAQSKHHKKVPKILLASLVLVFLVAVFVIVFQHYRNKPVATNKTNIESILPVSLEAKSSVYNKSTYSYAMGYVVYTAAKLTAYTSANNLATQYQQFSTPVTTQTDLSHVVFSQIGSSPNTSLVMYDFSTQKTYTIATSDGQHQTDYFNPVILSNHYVAYYTLVYTTPVSLTGSINVMNLETGNTTQLIEDSASVLPASSCCSVSSDGLYLSIINPSANKLSVYAAGGNELQDINVPGVQFVPTTQGSTTDTYTNAQNAAGYPHNLYWQSDNTLVLAKAPATRYVIDSGGDNLYPNPNGLVSFNTSSDAITPISNTDSYAITWFDITSKWLIFTAYDYQDANQELAGGPAGAPVDLYEVNLQDPSAVPIKLNSTPFLQDSGIVLDDTANNLYVQYDLPNAASDSYLITEYNLVNQTSTNFTVNSVGLGTLQGLYTSGELIFTDQNYIQIYDTATNNVVGQ
ncbi:MAG TPA: hypothetical protein VMQ52_00695 [Candidatus Saccharimonadales bacterium]|jgi:hypothetical protein|nr:hypothetical protein [Candidatus Saccharimonadales bacterium]